MPSHQRNSTTTMAKAAGISPAHQQQSGLNQSKPGGAVTRRTRFPASKSMGFIQFGFTAGEKYRAQQDLLTTRSNTFQVAPRQPPEDVWRRKPPDFRPQTYLPKPPKRNTRQSMQPEKYRTPTEDDVDAGSSEGDELKLPKILQPKRPKSRNFVNKFRVPGTEDAKKLFIKEGMFKKDKYVNPLKHDFRQYPPLEKLGLPEFETYLEPDPFDIKFKTKNIDIVYGLPRHGNDRYIGRQMGQPMSPQPRFEPEMLLPKQKWPNRAAEFTRHRPRVRTPHTALMDTIEEKLTKQWTLEKRERERRQKEFEKQEKERKFREQVAKGVAAATRKSTAARNEFDIPQIEEGHFAQRLPSNSTRSYVSEESTLC